MATLSPIRIIITGDSEDAKRAAKELDDSLSSAGNSISNFGSSLTSIGKITALVSLGTDALALAANLAPAVGILAILPAVAGAAAASIGTLFVGLSGLGAAFKSSASAGGAAAVNTRSYQQAIESAAYGVTQAEQALTASQQKELQAQNALNAARVQAAIDIAAYANKVADANLNEEGANIALQDAQRNLSILQSQGVTDALTLEKAHYAVANATQHLKEATENANQTQADATDAQAKGVDGNAKVIQAQQALAQAQQNVISSQEKLAQSQEQLANAQQNLADALNKSTGAVSAQAKALAALSPNARAFVETVLSLKGAWDSLKNAVQDTLFAGAAKQVDALAKVSFPTLRTGMVGVAGQFNGLAVAASQAMQTPMFQGALTTIFDGARTSLGQFVPAMQPLVTGLANLAAVGTPFLTQFTGWLADLAQRAGVFLSSAAGAQKMHDVLAKAVEVLQRVWAIGKDVLTFFGNLFKAADSSNMLGVLQSITGELAKWSGSQEGQQTLKTLFQTLGAIAPSLAQNLPTILGALSGIASAFSSLPGPVKTISADIFAWSIVFGPIISLLGTVVGMLTGEVAASFLTAEAQADTFAAKAAAAFGRFIASALSAVGSMIATAATMVWGWITMGAQATLSAGRMAAAWIIGVVTGAAEALVSMGIAVVGVVAGWVVMAATAVADAAVMAAAWLIAFWPIALIIAAVVALAAIVILNWGTIRDATIRVWSDVKQWTSDAWNGIVGIVSGVVNWFAGVPGQISRLAAGMWNGISDAFKIVINFIIRAWDSLKFTLPSMDFGPWGKVGGWTIQVPQLAQFASGGVASGWSWVGEKGAELVNFGSPSRVLNHSDSVSAAGGRSVHYEPTYQFNAPIYGVDDLEAVLAKHDEELMQLLEATG